MNSSNNNIIEFRNVSKRYVAYEDALKNVNFDLKLGEMAFLTGPSGAGKSTLLKLIAAMEESTLGDIIVAGQNISHLSRSGVASLRRALGMVFQDAQLLENYTVYENVALPLTLLGFREKDISSRVQPALELVGLGDKARRYATALSIGEQQRVGIARAIAHKPPLLLADEPTGNLDPALAAEIMQLFIELNKTGMSILIATHDLSLIASLHYRILSLKEGSFAS